MKLAVLVIAAVLLTGCAGAFQPEYQINLTAVEVKDQGVAMTGRSDISAFEWMNIATRACNEGAWDWDVAKQVFVEDIVAMADGTSRGGAQAVWLLLTGTCRELIPEDAIDRGPPPPGY
jgi:hypothetical protein